MMTERDFNLIHKYEMDKFFWKAKLHDLDADYVRATRAVCEWAWNDCNGDLVFSLAGNEFKFTNKTSIYKVEEFIMLEYRERKDYINTLLKYIELDLSDYVDIWEDVLKY